MWRRNGGQAEGQAYLYLSRKYCPGLRESDLLLLQLAAAITDNVDEFLVSLLARFRLAKWATGDLDTEATTRRDEFVEQCNGLAEEWLALVIAMIGERNYPGVGRAASYRGYIRKEVIHFLCIEPMSHSALIKKLPERRDLEKVVDEVITEVAELRSCAKVSVVHRRITVSLLYRDVAR